MGAKGRKVLKKAQVESEVDVKLGLEDSEFEDLDMGAWVTQD